LKRGQAKIAISDFLFNTGFGKCEISMSGTIRSNLRSKAKPADINFLEKKQ